MNKRTNVGMARKRTRRRRRRTRRRRRSFDEFVAGYHCLSLCPGGRNKQREGEESQFIK
jgi:hypothetical protein